MAEPVPSLKLTQCEEVRVERKVADTSLIKKNMKEFQYRRDRKRRLENTKTWKIGEGTVGHQQSECPGITDRR